MASGKVVVEGRDNGRRYIKDIPQGHAFIGTDGCLHIRIYWLGGEYKSVRPDTGDIFTHHPDHLYFLADAKITYST